VGVLLYLRSFQDGCQIKLKLLHDMGLMGVHNCFFLGLWDCVAAQSQIMDVQDCSFEIIF
jgi:hypothetical protein